MALNRNKRRKGLGMKTITHLSYNNLMDKIGYMPSPLPFFMSSASGQYRHPTLHTELALSKQTGKVQSFTSTHCYHCRQTLPDPLWAWRHSSCASKDLQNRRRLSRARCCKSVFPRCLGRNLPYNVTTAVIQPTHHFIIRHPEMTANVLLLKWEIKYNCLQYTRTHELWPPLDQGRSCI